MQQSPSQPAVTRLLRRGQASDPAEVVRPGAVGCASGRENPAEFGLPPDAPEGERRRKLAEWMTHPSNPLFSRVIVNRLWHYHFGVGIVETPNDLGHNGGRPSHPELLEWLAAELVSRGFHVKDIHRLIVTSSTYRQSSASKEEGLADDVEDRLLWRRNPQRSRGGSPSRHDACRRGIAQLEDGRTKLL